MLAERQTVGRRYETFLFERMLFCFHEVTNNETRRTTSRRFYTHIQTHSRRYLQASGFPNNINRARKS